MGQRAPRSLTYGGTWEFLGGGSLAVGEDPTAAARRELLEEAGVSGVPVPVALLFDAKVGTWDIVHRVDLGAVRLEDPRSWEHTALAVEPRPGTRQPRSHATDLLIPLTA
jgi:8-oxo-dGTP pyrophosphatase MutT (NUDIX family)